MSWYIQKNNTVGSNEVLKSPNGTPGEDGTVGKEYMCLVDGMYQFTICDSIVDELWFAGNYNVTSDGNLIVMTIHLYSLKRQPHFPFHLPNC